MNDRNTPLFVFCLVGLFGAFVIAVVMHSYGRLF